MKKNNKGLIAGIVILILLIVVYLILKATDLDGENEKSTEEEAETAFEIDAEDIAELKIESGDSEYTFLHSDDKWTYANDEAFPLSESAVLNVVSSVTSVTYTRELEGADELEEYGLDSPQVKAVVKDTDGNETELSFGDDNESVSGCYMTKSGSDSVYLVESSVKSGLEFQMNDLAEKEEVPSITASTITNVNIENNGAVENLGKDDTSETGWSYKAKDGSSIEADSSKVSEYMNAYTGITWTDFVTYDTSDLAAYGLDNPMKITVDYQVTETVSEDAGSSGDEDASAGDAETDEDAEAGEEDESTSGSSSDSEVSEENAEDTSSAEDSTSSEDTEETEVQVDKQAVFLIGGQDSEGNYYAKLQDDKYIYTLASATVESMTTIQEEDLVSELVADYSFADLDKVTFVRNGVTYVANKKETEVESEDDEEETTTETTYYINDKEIDKTEFSTFFSTITSMEWQERAGEAEPGGTPEMSVTFEKEGGINKTVDYYSYDSNFYLVVDSKGNKMFVNKMKVKDMLDSFDALIESMNEE